MSGSRRFALQRDGQEYRRAGPMGVFVIRVRHFGNTANNAYYNALILERHGAIESHLPIRMFGLRHAISAPAWEAVDFEVPNPQWVASPDWSSIPEGQSVNADYSDLGSSATVGAHDAQSAKSGVRAKAMSVARAVLLPLYGRRWAQPIFDLSYGVVLGSRPVLPEEDTCVDILYGASSLARLRIPRPAPRLVSLEHGTLRWIAEGGRDVAVLRRAYRRQVEQSGHVWVTNLDPRTLEIAEDLVPGRWSALPHPFLPDDRVPFPESGHRRELLRQTGSDRLVLLPASQNWSRHHDKGSMKALTAFVELRRGGADVGLVAVEWGLQLAESREFLDDAGVDAHVAWVPPMARFSLQRMMADVDVVWDQFGLDAFGALALRALEQGTPLVSRGLAPAGEALIGGPVPWRPAATTEEIVRETLGVFEEMLRRGRESVIADTSAEYRTWLFERHSPTLTAALQRDVYERMVDGTFQPGSAAPDEWARRIGPAGKNKG